MTVRDSYKKILKNLCCFYIKKGNPRNIQGFPDLQRADIIFANREKGSSRRVYLDRQLNKLGISPENISGYRNELVSDSSTAAAVAGGQADIALGEAYTARTFTDLEFLPLGTETMYLVMASSSFSSPGFQAVVNALSSESFRQALSLQTGYDTSHTGEAACF